MSLVEIMISLAISAGRWAAGDGAKLVAGDASDLGGLAKDLRPHPIVGRRSCEIVPAWRDAPGNAAFSVVNLLHCDVGDTNSGAGTETCSWG